MLPDTNDFGVPLWAKIHFDFASLPSNATITTCIARCGQPQDLSAFKVTKQKSRLHEIFLDFVTHFSRIVFVQFGCNIKGGILIMYKLGSARNC